MPDGDYFTDPSSGLCITTNCAKRAEGKKVLAGKTGWHIVLFADG